MQIYWLALLGAIIAEVIATTCLKLSDGMSRPLPTLAMFLGYGVAFSLLAFTVTRIELSISYAIWSGLGVVLTMLVGLLFFSESFSAAKLFCTGLIVAGVAGLYLIQPD